MSGYLQRIASGVLHPQCAIHPAVGSLWAPQRNAFPPEQLSETLAPIIPRRSALTDAQQANNDLTRMSTEQQTAPDSSNPVEAKLGPIHPLLTVRDAAMTQARDRQDADATASRTAFSPLVTASLGELLPQTHALSPVSTPRRETLQRTLPLIAPSKPQADEVEIHIGRIEVAAVLPQPALRLPARKSIDLGEYLKRGRGSQ